MMDVFFDVDGCLIDTKYQPNMDMDEFRALVAEKIATGWFFHINSNRSNVSLLKLREQFGFNGTLISENGIAVYDPRTDETITADGFTPIDRDELSGVFEFRPRSKVRYIATSQLANEPIRFAHEFEGPENTVYFIENTRQYTATVYPRVDSAELTSCTPELLEATVELLSGKFPNFDVTTSPAYGNVLMIPKGANKGSTMRDIADGQVASFGDGSADVSMFEISDYFGVPSNGDEAVMQAARTWRGFVADRPYTQGAYDFLLQLKEAK
jgi:HAD superfamily hydrolase (TIGR01484 family)